MSGIQGKGHVHKLGGAKQHYEETPLEWLKQIIWWGVYGD